MLWHSLLWSCLLSLGMCLRLMVACLHLRCIRRDVRLRGDVAAGSDHQLKVLIVPLVVAFHLIQVGKESMHQMINGLRNRWRCSGWGWGDGC